MPVHFPTLAGSGDPPDLVDAIMRAERTWIVGTNQKPPTTNHQPPMETAEQNRSAGQKSYWSAMSPEQRHQEMIRRRQVAAAKRAHQAPDLLTTDHEEASPPVRRAPRPSPTVPRPRRNLPSISDALESLRADLEAQLRAVNELLSWTTR